MRRLWVQLTLAFTLIVLITVGVIAFLMTWTTNTEFNQYITHSSMRASGSGIQQLVSFFEEQGSWDNVDSLLEQGIQVRMPPGFSPRTPSKFSPPLKVKLADAKGIIIFDSTGSSDRRMNFWEKPRALPITRENNEVIGYLMLKPPDRPDWQGTLEQRFIDRIQTVVITGAVLAVILGLVSGVIMSRNLAAPLQKLAEAARAVACGRLDQQVPVEGSTEIADVAQAFNEMTAALENSEQQRQSMVADIAHELRTPLSVLQGNLQAILDDVYALDKSEVSRLYDETRLLSRLVEDLRDLALADAGQLNLNRRAIDAGDTIRSTLTNLDLAADAKEIDLGHDLPSAPLLVYADPDRLAQIMRNLLMNALHHTPKGGTVLVHAESLPAQVRIQVRDTGQGISPHDLPHIFERFWRADRSRSREEDGGGSGLGLSVVRSLVEAHGGQIWASTVLNEGTEFTFTLPMPGDTSQ